MVKWPFLKLKRSIWYGNSSSLLVFVESLIWGSFLLWFTQKSSLKKKSYTKMSTTLNCIKLYLVCLSVCSSAEVFNRKPLQFLFKHPISTRSPRTDGPWDKRTDEPMESSDLSLPLRCCFLFSRQFFILDEVQRLSTLLQVQVGTFTRHGRIEVIYQFWRRNFENIFLGEGKNLS